MKIKIVFFAILGLLFSTIGLATPENVYSSIVTLVAAIPLISEFLISWWGLKNFLAQLLTWVIGILLALIGWFFDLGFFAGEAYALHEALLIGIVMSLISNGLWPAVLRPVFQAR